MSRELKDLQSYGYLIDDSALCALSPIPVLPYQPIRGAKRSIRSSWRRERIGGNPAFGIDELLVNAARHIMLIRSTRLSSSHERNPVGHQGTGPDPCRGRAVGYPESGGHGCHRLQDRETR